MNSIPPLPFSPLHSVNTMVTLAAWTFSLSNLAPLYFPSPPPLLPSGPLTNQLDMASIYASLLNPLRLACPDDLPAAAIPSSVFYLPPSVQDTSPSLVPHDLLPLTRSLLRLQSPTLLDIKAHFWTWWRHRKCIGISPKTDAHHVHVLKKLISNPTSQLLTVPRASWEWLLHQFPTDSFPSIFAHGHHVIVPLISSSPNYSYNMMLNRLLNPPYAHGLNSPLPPPILGANAASPPRKLPLIMASYVPPRVPHVLLLPPLIEPSALLVTSGKNPHCHMTRSGSPFSLPIPLTVIPSLNVPPLLDASLYHAVITSPDSAPGADGIPYSAWRICPRITTQALENHFQSILTRTASPPLQSLVFIPKADQGEYADNYRPLGLPNTCDRILDRSVYSPFSHCLLGALHPAQALLNLFREPQFNYLDIQHFLDNAMHSHSVLLSDLAKAFERVNPHWIMHVLVARATPYWVLTYCRHILFGRKVLQKIKSHFRPPLAIHNGDGLSVFSSFVSPWIPGITTFIVFPGFSPTGDIWMTMPQVASAYNGSLKPRHSSTTSPPQA